MVPISKQDVARLRATVGKVVPKKTSLEILRSVRVQEMGDRATVTGTDLETAVTLKVKTLCGTLPAYLVPWDAISKLKGDVWIESLPENKVRIECAGVKRTVASMPVEDYPHTDAVTPDGDPLFIPGAFLKTVADFGYCASRDMLRPPMMGVGIDARAGKIKAALTDGRRLAVITSQAAAGELAEIWPLVPAQILAGLGADVTIYHTGEYCSLATAGDVRMIFQRINGTYPNWRNLIPKDLPYTFNVDAAEMCDALAGLDTKLPSVDLDSNDGMLTLKQADIEAGTECSARVGVSVCGAAVGITFNPAYLKEIFANMGDGAVTVRWVHANMAVLIESPARANVTVLLMPVRRAD